VEDNSKQTQIINVGMIKTKWFPAFALSASSPRRIRPIADRTDYVVAASFPTKRSTYCAYVFKAFAAWQ
jgi:hypothetical protein